MCGYAGAVRKKRLIMLLKCYADDSGNSEQKEAPDGGLFVIAGYMMSEERWEDFAERWDAQLKRDYPIEYLHMIEAEPRNGQFVGMPEEFRNRKLLDLALVIKECDPVPINVQLKWNNYVEIVKDKVPSKMDSPYAVLFFQLMRAVCDLQIDSNHYKNIGHLPGEWIFDKQGGEGLRCLDWYADLEARAPEPYKTMMANTPAFREDKYLAPLQAADMLAWHIRREICFPHEKRPILDIITPAGMFYREIGPDQLNQYVKLSARVDPTRLK